MTDLTDPRRNLHPSVASARSWWFGGDFWGVRYEAAFGIRVLEPGPPGPAADLRAVGSPEADPRPGRTQVEAWEGEGGAVGE